LFDQFPTFCNYFNTILIWFGFIVESQPLFYLYDSSLLPFELEPGKILPYNSFNYSIKKKKKKKKTTQVSQKFEQLKLQDVLLHTD
jgi:hypothetical protein